MQPVFLYHNKVFKVLLLHRYSEKKKKMKTSLFMNYREYKIIIYKGFDIGADRQDNSHGKKEKNTNRPATNR